MAKTGSERTIDWRTKLIAEGYRQKGFLLSPKALAALAKLAKIDGSEREAVEAAIFDRAKRKVRP